MDDPSLDESAGDVCGLSFSEAVHLGADSFFDPETGPAVVRGLSPFRAEVFFDVPVLAFHHQSVILELLVLSFFCEWGGRRQSKVHQFVSHETHQCWRDRTPGIACKRRDGFE